MQAYSIGWMLQETFRDDSIKNYLKIKGQVQHVQEQQLAVIPPCGPTGIKGMKGGIISVDALCLL